MCEIHTIAAANRIKGECATKISPDERKRNRAFCTSCFPLHHEIGMAIVIDPMNSD